MAKASRRRLLAACKVAALAVALEAALMAMLIATSQPPAKRLRAPGKTIVYDRTLAKTVIEVPTGRAWTVAPDGTETITREGD